MININNASTDHKPLPAGCFSSWLRRLRSALIKEDGSDVPCGECNACCKSSYFIHIRPEETGALAVIPKELLFPAPGLPKGNLLMGYTQQGCCPMLVENKCSIYEDRPITCRNYDCRIFSAAGIAAGEVEKARINQQLTRWEFGYPTQRDREQHEAVQAAARFLREHAEYFPGGVPSAPAQLAILAIKVSEVFLKCNREPGKSDVRPVIEIAKDIMEANERFEVRRQSLATELLGGTQ